MNEVIDQLGINLSSCPISTEMHYVRHSCKKINESLVDLANPNGKIQNKSNEGECIIH